MYVLSSARPSNDRNVCLCFAEKLSIAVYSGFDVRGDGHVAWYDHVCAPVPQLHVHFWTLIRCAVHQHSRSSMVGERYVVYTADGMQATDYQQGTIWIYIAVWLCSFAVVASMAEMASMAPTSGGQYHWVSLLQLNSLSIALLTALATGF